MSSCGSIKAERIDCPSSRRSTTWALRWWSRGARWYQPGLIWPSWFTLWKTAAQMRSNCHRFLTAPSPTLTLPPHRNTPFTCFFSPQAIKPALTLPLTQTFPASQKSFITDSKVSPFFIHTCDWRGCFGSGRISVWRRHSRLSSFPLTADRRSRELRSLN